MIYKKIVSIDTYYKLQIVIQSNFWGQKNQMGPSWIPYPNEIMVKYTQKIV